MKQSTTQSKIDKEIKGEDLRPDLLSTPVQYSATCTPPECDKRIESWIEVRCNLITSYCSDNVALRKKLDACDKQFIVDMSHIVPKSSQTSYLNSMLSYARDLCLKTEEELANKCIQDGLVIRDQVERSITNTWKQIGWLRGVPNARNQILELEKDFKEQKGMFSKALAGQMTFVYGSDEAKVQKLVDNAIDEIASSAEKVGEESYVQAHKAAIELYNALPGRAKNSYEMFQILSGFSFEQRQEVLKAYKIAFHESFDIALEIASNSVVAKAKNFFKIPALKAALEEKYGIGVGLFEAKEYIFPHPKNWKAMLAKQKNKAVTFMFAVKKVLIPSFRDFNGYKRELFEFFESLMDKAAGPELARTKAILVDDNVEAVTHSLLLYLWDNDPEMKTRLCELLLHLTEDERGVVESRFEERYADNVGGKSLREALGLFLPEEEANVIEAHLDGDPVLALYHEFKCGLEKSKLEQIELLQKFSTIPNDLRVQVREQFGELEGEALDREYFEKHFTLEPLLDWAVGIAEGDSLMVSTARLECSLKRISREWPGIVFYDKSESDDQKIIKNLESRYKTDFEKQFKKLKGNERSLIMQTLVDNGSLDVAEQLRHCISGVGADTIAIRALVEGRSKRNLDRISTRYSQKFNEFVYSTRRMLFGSVVYSKTFLTSLSFDKAKSEFAEIMYEPRSLEEDFRRNLCGYNLFDVKSLMQGKTNNPNRLYERFMKRYQFEHAGVRYVSPEERSSKVVGRYAKKVIPQTIRNLANKAFKEDPLKIAKQNCSDDVHLFYQKNKENFEVSPSLAKELKVLISRANLVLDNYRVGQQKKAEFYSNVGSAITATGAYSGLLFMGLPYLPLVVICGMSSLAGRSVMKTIFKGKGYGSREFKKDAFMAAVDGFTLGLGKAVLGIKYLRFLGFGRNLLSSAIKLTFKKSLYRWGDYRITENLLKSKESGHSRRFLEREAEESESMFGRRLELSREEMIKKIIASPNQSRRIDRVFHRIARNSLLVNDDATLLS